MLIEPMCNLHLIGSESKRNETTTTTADTL